MRLAILLLALALPISALADRPPNVVFIIADDDGWADLSVNNPETFYDTPNLQALADSGVNFTNAYAACPVCSPTRSSVLTGQYPARTRNTDYFGAPNEYLDKLPAKDAEPDMEKISRFKNRAVWPAPYLGKLAADHTTLAEALKAKGYATFFAGKWHLGPEGSWPTDHGFDINKGGNKGGGPYGGKKYFSPYGNPTLEDGPDGEHLPDRLASETVKFITDNKDKPFLAYLSFYSVHTPLMGRKDLVEKYEKRKAALSIDKETIFGYDHPRKVREVQEHAVYAAMVDAMDQAVGKVMAGLKDLGLEENTIVIFTSDNGGLSTSEGWATSNIPLRGGKGWLYEGGIREPLIVRWPGKTQAGTSSKTPVTSTDYFPTILELCGLPDLPDQHKDGVSFTSSFVGGTSSHSRKPLFWHYPHWGNQGGIPGSAVRSGDWKYIEYYWGKEPELFNLADDLAEKNNLAKTNPEKLAELKTILDDYRKDTDALAPTLNPNYKKSFEDSKW